MLQKPRALMPGQTVGLIAPSFVLPRPERLPRAVSWLERAGYRVVVGESCRARHGYFAGTDTLRAADINRMFRDDKIDAILCARGGYGATRILSLLEYNVIRANPKVLSGFSDITALHSALQTQAGLVTFHGAMAVSDMGEEPPDAFGLDSFFRVAGNPAPAGLLGNPPGFPRVTLRGGRASGPIVGGNLSLVVSCLGTPYAFDFDGALLFLEEVGEKTYAVDRMLTQLKNAGVFDRVAGVLLGQFTDCEPNAQGHFTMDEMLADFLPYVRVPVLAGLQCGHVVPRMTLPLGVPCEMDADARTLRALEGAVR